MDRRSFITGLAAGTAALAHTGLAQASTSEAFSKKTRPVDTMNRIGGWTNGSVEVIDIKGVRIGEGRPKLIAPTTSKTEADLIATVKKFADMPALNVIEVRIDYLGKIDPKDYARITRDAYAAAGDKVCSSRCATARTAVPSSPTTNGTAASTRPSSRKAAPTSSTLSSSVTAP